MVRLNDGTLLCAKSLISVSQEDGSGYSWNLLYKLNDRLIEGWIRFSIPACEANAMTLGSVKALRESTFTWRADL